jgi:outer membrane protein assembly factor BamB
MKNYFRFLSLLCAVVILAACSDASNLEQPAPLVIFTPSVTVQKVWSRNVGGTDDQLLNLTIAHDNKFIYTASHDGDVYALDPMTGDKMWAVDLDRHIISGPNVGNGMMVLAAENGDIIALNTNNGAILWEQNVPQQTIGSMAISSTAILLKTVSDNLVALNPQNGLVLWDFNAGAPALILRGGSQPVIQGNQVIAGFSNGQMGVFNLKTGIPVWMSPVALPQGSFPVERMVDVSMNPLIKNGIIYVADYQGNIAALQMISGQPVWDRGFSSYTGLVFNNNQLIVTDYKSHVWALQQTDGVVLWRQLALEARGTTAPTMYQGYIVLGDAEGYVHLLSTVSGGFVARVQLSDDPITTPAVVFNNMFYVLDNDGHLAAYQIVG